MPLTGTTFECIVTGEKKYISAGNLKRRLAKFGSQQEFAQHYICVAAKKLLRKGMTVDEIRKQLNVTQELARVPNKILARLKLLKKKPRKQKDQAAKLERQRYLNSKEYKDKMIAWKDRQKNMTFEEWVREYTGTGRERGGTCIRPDIFLSWNNRACDGCQCYEFCMCYQKRLSHEKKKPRRRKY